MTGAEHVDLLLEALERYRTLAAYRVTLISTAYGTTDVIRYAYKKPGLVRMDLVSPYSGAVLVYDPAVEKVRLWPAGPRFFSLSLNPDNRLIRSRTGQRIDRSDIGALLENVLSLRQGGKCRVSNVAISDRDALLVAVTGGGDRPPGAIHRYNLYLDGATLLPLKVVSLDSDDGPIEYVVFEELEADPALADDFFRP